MTPAEFIARQARRPSGPFGRLLARIWIHETASANRVALDLLEIGPEDRVLEIGFGHGRTIGKAAARAARGFVAGADPSPLMVRVARGHNARLIREGRADLRLSDGVNIPFDDGAFDRVFSVHTLYFWPDPKATLREIRRVLKAGGRLVLGFRAAKDGARPDRYPPSVYRFHEPGEVRDLLQAAGYTGVRIERRQDAGNAATWAVARKP